MVYVYGFCDGYIREAMLELTRLFPSTRVQDIQTIAMSMSGGKNIKTNPPELGGRKSF